MSAPGAVPVVVLGTGAMGSGIARLVLGKPALALAGVFARRPERAGADVATLLGLAAVPATGRVRTPSHGSTVSNDLPALLDRARPRVAVQATCSHLADAEPEIVACLERGVSVVSIAEELAWPAATSPAWAARIDRLARERGAALLGTGVNPGFVLDWLLVALTGACARVRALRARRVNDLSPYGPTVLRAQGVGTTPGAFRAGVARGTVVGHVGFPQSVAMIAAALGWTLDPARPPEETREPIVSKVVRETTNARVEAGQVAGCLHTVRAFVEGRADVAIALEHPQQIRPEAEAVATGDTLEIDGDPPLRLVSRPEIPGGAATIALAVNAVPRVLAAPPGLHAMTDLPAPAALPDASPSERAPSTRSDA